MPDLIPDLLANVAAVLPPPQGFGDAAMRMYLSELNDIPPGLLERALHQIVRTKLFFPKVSEIREVAAELALNLPTEADALDQIEARMRWARLPDEARGEGPTLDPLVLKALDHVGGFYSFKTSENPVAIRGQFMRLYRDLRTHTLQEAQVGTRWLTLGRGQSSALAVTS